MVKKPANQVVRQMPCEIIQHEYDAQWKKRSARWVTQPRLPLRTQRALGFRRECFGGGCVLALRPPRAPVLLEPGMADRIGHPGPPLCPGPASWRAHRA